MSGAGKQPYAVHAVAFWAIERAYQEAWNSHMPMAQPYQTYAEVGWGGCSHAWAASRPATGSALPQQGGQAACLPQFHLHCCILLWDEALPLLLPAPLHCRSAGAARRLGSTLQGWSGWRMRRWRPPAPRRGEWGVCWLRSQQICICHWHLYCRALACLLMRLFEPHGRFFTSCLPAPPACLPACLAVQAGGGGSV